MAVLWKTKESGSKRDMGDIPQPAFVCKECNILVLPSGLSGGIQYGNFSKHWQQWGGDLEKGLVALLRAAEMEGEDAVLFPLCTLRANADKPTLRFS